MCIKLYSDYKNDAKYYTLLVLFTTKKNLWFVFVGNKTTEVTKLIPHQDVCQVCLMFQEHISHFSMDMVYTVAIVVQLGDHRQLPTVHKSWYQPSDFLSQCEKHPPTDSKFPFSSEQTYQESLLKQHKNIQQSI